MKLTNNQIRQGSGELNWNILTQYSMARDDSNHLSSCTSPIKNNNLPGWDLGRNCWAAACRPAFSAHRSHQNNYWAPTKAAYVPVRATGRPPVLSEPIWIESPSGLCPCVTHVLHSLRNDQSRLSPLSRIVHSWAEKLFIWTTQQNTDIFLFNLHFCVHQVRTPHPKYSIRRYILKIDCNKDKILQLFFCCCCYC